VRSGLQHPLVAEDDRQKSAKLFFESVTGSGLARFQRFTAEITMNLHRETDQLRFNELGEGLKVNFFREDHLISDKGSARLSRSQ
jgi:hypothetical protein